MRRHPTKESADQRRSRDCGRRLRSSATRNETLKCPDPGRSVFTQKSSWTGTPAEDENGECTRDHAGTASGLTRWPEIFRAEQCSQKSPSLALFWDCPRPPRDVRSCWVCEGRGRGFRSGLGHSSGVWSSQDRRGDERALASDLLDRVFHDHARPAAPGRGKRRLPTCPSDRPRRGNWPGTKGQGEKEDQPHPAS
jgi:hypothetical protein